MKISIDGKTDEQRRRDREIIAEGERRVQGAMSQLEYWPVCGGGVWAKTGTSIEGVARALDTIDRLVLGYERGRGARLLREGKPKTMDADPRAASC